MSWEIYIVKNLRAIKFRVTAKVRRIQAFLSFRRSSFFWKMIKFFIIKFMKRKLNRLKWTAINHISFFSPLQVNGAWSLPNVVCDFYIAMDVICSTSSIFNLVAISIDRWVRLDMEYNFIGRVDFIYKCMLFQTFITFFFINQCKE